MALTFPPLRVESPLSQLHQVGIQILTSPSPHSNTQLLENRPKSVYCPTHVVRSWGIVQMANIAAAADIAGFILQYCAESCCYRQNRAAPHLYSGIRFPLGQRCTFQILILTKMQRRPTKHVKTTPFKLLRIS